MGFLSGKGRDVGGFGGGVGNWFGVVFGWVFWEVLVGCLGMLGWVVGLLVRWGRCEGFWNGDWGLGCFEIEMLLVGGKREVV